jgi:hypothetical protein
MTMTNTDGKILPLPMTAAQKARAEREAKTVDLMAFAAALAQAIGWHHVPDENMNGNCTQIITRDAVTGDGPMARTNTPRLIISQRWHKDRRIEISGCWPYAEGQGVITPGGVDGKARITVAHDKSAWKVAGEVQNRLLPGYLAAWDVCMARVESYRAHEAASKGLAERLADGAGVQTRGMRGASSGRESFSVWGAEPDDDDGRCYASVQVSGDSVSIDCRGLTEAQAAAILAIVKGG